MTAVLFALLACAPEVREPVAAPAPAPAEPVAEAAEPVPAPPAAAPPVAAPTESYVLWLPLDSSDPCNVHAVGDRVQLYWSDDAAGTTGLVDEEARVEAREEGRIGIRTSGTLPPGTRAVPAYALSRQKPPECAEKQRRRVRAPVDPWK